MATQERRTVTVEDLGAEIALKRKSLKLTLETAADICGVSPSTLWRLERYSSSIRSGLPVRNRETDEKTLSKISEWLEVDIAPSTHQQSQFDSIAATTASSSKTPDVVEAHLRADKNLDPKTAEALAELFRSAYEQFSTMRPKYPK